VPRILVADDNSNIQKMVGLALKDQGIDVVAVGNGEAAVRKISDLKPDLVLADVFMPVRNGYEVCKFVKEDSSLAHIPVILLVGAFDPLDEQEAQRVGADGVLKKPFVPPDPLISMVKSALQRASAAHSGAVTEKAAVPAMAGRASSTPAASAPPTVFPVPQEEAPVASFVEEIPPAPEALKIESGGKPLAFGSLLETPAAEPDDAVFVAPPNPELADRDWSTEEQDVEEEEEESGNSAWRRDGGSDDFAPEPAGEAEKTAARAKRRESWTPTREKTQNLLEEAVAPEIVAPSKPSVRYEAPAPQNSWAAPKAEPLLVESKKIAEVPAPSKVEIAPPVIASAPETGAQDTAKPNGGNSWFSATGSPWEAEAQKANQLASAWDAPSAAAPSNASETIEEEPANLESTPEAVQSETPQTVVEPSYDFVSEAPSEEPVHYVAEPDLVQNEVVAHNPLPELISEGSISPETVENIRQETSYALESVAQAVVEKSAESAVKIAEPSQPDMDTLVANVLAKMSPEMLQAVTREILKPVVAAMIRDEINAKKS
jgi:CheY-like chemotaxis protein